MFFDQTDQTDREFLVCQYCNLRDWPISKYFMAVFTISKYFIALFVFLPKKSVKRSVSKVSMKA